MEPAIPILVELLDQEDETVHVGAARLLADVRAIPALSKALSSPSARTRKNAAYGLLRASFSAEAARPALLASLDDPDPGVRMNVCAALVAMDVPLVDCWP